MRFAASMFAALVACLALATTASAHSRRASLHTAVNQVRHANGLRHLVRSRPLARAARAHTSAMVRGNFFAHGAFAQRVRHFVPARTVGETLAMAGDCSPANIVQMWMNSPPHRAVLLSGAFHRVGFGVRHGRLGSFSGCVVTADFAS